MFRSNRLIACLAVPFFLLNCQVENDETRTNLPALCAVPVSAEIPAPDWVKERVGVASYRYSAPIETPEVILSLLGEAGELLGELAVQQLYADANHPDGALQGVLRIPGEEERVLVTRGVLEPGGYREETQLTQGKIRVDISSSFELKRCFGEVAAPSCAGLLPTQEAAYTLPSCGLLFDDALRAGQAPELKELVYRAPEKGLALDVLLNREVKPAADVMAWAERAQVDALIGSEAVRLLTTVFSDRSWWRELERHMSHCLGEIEAGGAEQSELNLAKASFGSIQQPLCDGSGAKPKPSDWAQASPKTNSAKGSGFWGDPHLVSLDGDAFDFQGVGEYVLVRSTDGEPFELQARFEAMSSSQPFAACQNISVGTAIALRSGAQRLTVQTGPEFSVRLDGELISARDGFMLQDGGQVSLSEGVLRVVWLSGQELSFERTGATSQLKLALPDSRAGRVRGLLGQFDGSPENDRITQAGEVLAQPLSFHELYRVFGDSWRVSEASSLFDYAPGQGTLDYTNNNFPEDYSRLDEVPAELRAEAETKCASAGIIDPALRMSCVLDSICLGDGAIDAASRQAAPSAISSISEPAVWVIGAARVLPLGSSLELSPKAEALHCEPAEPLFVRVSAETALTLSEGLQVNTVDVGALLPSGSQLETIDAGVSVQSFLMTRRAGALPGPLTGKVRFREPILGVIFHDETLESARQMLGVEGLDYPSGPQGLEPTNDRLTLSADRKTLTFSLDGADADVLRVITEAP